MSDDGTTKLYRQAQANTGEAKPRPRPEIIEGEPDPKPYKVERDASDGWERIGEYPTAAEAIADAKKRLGQQTRVLKGWRQVWPPESTT